MDTQLQKARKVAEFVVQTGIIQPPPPHPFAPSHIICYSFFIFHQLPSDSSRHCLCFILKKQSTFLNVMLLGEFLLYTTSGWMYFSHCFITFFFRFSFFFFFLSPSSCFFCDQTRNMFRGVSRPFCLGAVPLQTKLLTINYVSVDLFSSALQNGKGETTI